MTLFSTVFVLKVAHSVNGEHLGVTLAQQDDTACKCKVPLPSLFCRGFNQQTLKVPVPSTREGTDLAGQTPRASPCLATNTHRARLAGQ